MKLQRIAKLFTKNLTIISIAAAFVLGFIGMSDVQASLFNTSLWFKEETSLEAGDSGLRIVSQAQLDNGSGNQTQQSGTEASDSESSVDPNQVEQSGNVSADPSSLTSDTTIPEGSSSEESSSDTSADPSATEDTTVPDTTASETADSKTSETTREPEDTESTTTEKVTEDTEQTTEAPQDSTTEAPQDIETEAPETSEEPETTTEAETEAPTTEAPTTTTEAVSLGDTSGYYDDDAARAVLELVNQEREANGLEPLSWSGSLAKAAKIRATEIVVKWSHTRPDGSDWYTVSDLTYGENLAYGQTSSSEAVEAWMNSSGHKANILGDYSTLGVACYICNGTYYWAQEFGF
ncbi:MAG: hypothetical protein J5379_06985 [Clostridiales bacterium]|nr:hypothetical protein [Clostridiales bacterium]